MTKVLGDVVSLHDAQPMMPFVEIYVADHVLRSEFKTGTKSRSPEYLQSFEFNKLETSGTFTMVLFDKNWTELEETFNAGSQNVKIKYGYVTGKQSPLYKSIVCDYTIQYRDAGVILGINGIVNEAMANTKLMTLNTGSKNPTEAVKSICRAQGWKIGNFDTTYDVSLPNSDFFALIKEHPISYVNQYISPYAVRKADGLSGFRLVLDNSTNPATAHFLPLVAQATSVKTYIYGKGINSSVISLDVTAKGVFGGAGISGGSTSIQVETIDPVTGEVTSSVTTTSDVTSTSGAYTNTPSTQEDVLSSGGQSGEMSISSASYSTSLRNSIPYEGTITILGDPSLSVGDTIRIIVPTSKGNLHISSGLYFVKSVAESISGGKYVTSMAIVRSGVEDGLEILNYKELVR